MIGYTKNGADFEKHLSEQLLPPLPIVQQSTLSVHMSGFLRLQIPCKPETQMLYDLIGPELKMEPHKSGDIAAEAQQAQKFAIEQFTATLKNSPQLRTIQNPVQLRCTFAVVDGKLFYVYLCPVRTVRCLFR